MVHKTLLGPSTLILQTQPHGSLTLLTKQGHGKLNLPLLENTSPPGYYYNGKVYSSLAAVGSYVVGAFSGPTYLESAYYKPSSTSVVNFTVQTDQVYSWPPSILPNDYWKRPVSPMNREWYSIIGDYPYAGRQYNPPANTNAYASNYKFTPYVQAPNSCHVVWARMGALASIEGGDNGQKTIGSGEGNLRWQLQA